MYLLRTSRTRLRAPLASTIARRSLASLAHDPKAPLEPVPGAIVEVPGKEPLTPLIKEMADQIRFSGPLSVAQYMRRVLTHPVSGYYMQQEVFGLRGDFVTSPEISQIFGELIGVWFMSNWLQMGAPRRVQAVELGPGKGTLMADMTRSLGAFADFAGALARIVFVEASPRLREEQLKAIAKARGCAVEKESRNEFHHLQNARLADGLELCWYENVKDIVEDDHTFLVAHEFFDALPIFKFKKTENGWREIMVDIDESTDTPYHFRYVLAPEKTPSVGALVDATGRYTSHAVGDVIEVCPEATGAMQGIADVLGKSGGSGLIVDYGNDHPAPASLRAIHQHQFTHLFSRPGQADLSADVDFSLLRWALEPYLPANAAAAGKPALNVFGPTTQRHFLARLGIEERARSLLRSTANADEKHVIRTALTRLMSAREMGTVYKFMAVADPSLKVPAPVGFEAPDFPKPEVSAAKL
ncbi:hypothetical protein H9P43_005631 [Blastocladiella emersonii ATCC 22665]|nr:hypothetical protein H9P43_005631 [Blastocladiella emersonii ATCC 22665]